VQHWEKAVNMCKIVRVLLSPTSCTRKEVRGFALITAFGGVGATHSAGGESG